MRKEFLDNLMIYHADRVSKEIKDGLKTAKETDDKEFLSAAETEGLKEKVNGLERSKDYILEVMAENKSKEENEERERVKKGLPRRTKNQKN